MMGMGFGGFGFIFMILFWVLIIGLAVWLISRLFPQTTGSSSAPRSGGGHIEAPSSPEEILKRRYAQGELTTSEFEEMREHLRR